MKGDCPGDDPPEEPTITHDVDDFLHCCETLLSLRSFYSYAGEHCVEAVPMTEEFHEGFRRLDLDLLKWRTQYVADLLKALVNRGEGTNKWNIPKFIDLML